jgi:hypothetical protein
MNIVTIASRHFLPDAASAAPFLGPQALDAAGHMSTSAVYAGYPRRPSCSIDIATTATLATSGYFSVTMRR